MKEGTLAHTQDWQPQKVWERKLAHTKNDCRRKRRKLPRKCTLVKCHLVFAMKRAKRQICRSSSRWPGVFFTHVSIGGGKRKIGNIFEKKKSWNFDFFLRIAKFLIFLTISYRQKIIIMKTNHFVTALAKIDERLEVFLFFYRTWARMTWLDSGAGQSPE